MPELLLGQGAGDAKVIKNGYTRIESGLTVRRFSRLNWLIFGFGNMVGVDRKAIRSD